LVAGEKARRVCPLPLARGERIGTLMEELNAKAIAPGVQPDLIWRCNDGASVATRITMAPAR
jgi:hypothetical protein